MNKSVKIILGIIVVIAILTASVFTISIAKTKAENKVNVEEAKPNIQEKEIGRIVKINGTLYYDTGRTNNVLRCGMMDGKITSNVDSNEIPTEDNQSNFEGEYGYQGGGNTIEILIDGNWVVFETK